ncbi:MAG: hypothetical protein ABEJ87_05835 [Candidatus Nanohalobium sp.]
MGLVGGLLSEGRSLEEEVRQDPLGLDGERFMGPEDVRASPQRIQQYLSVGGFDVAVDNVHDRGLDTTGEDKLHPFLVSEAAAIDESLRVQEPRRDYLSQGDVADLGMQVFQDVVEEVEASLEGYEVSEDSDFSSELDLRDRSSVMSAIAPDETASFRYVKEDGSWRLVDELESSGPVRGVELYRKRTSHMGDKVSHENPGKMWRIRETDLVREDGDWTVESSWAEDPTPETESVRETISDVVESYSEEIPSLEYTLFASGYEGRMTAGSDIEHSLHIDVEDLGLEDNRQVYEDAAVRDRVRHLRKQITSDIVDSIDEELDISMGYGYSATRDQGTEYGFSRKSHNGQDSRIVFDGEGYEHLEEYDEFLEGKGLTRMHPTRK